MNYNSLSNYLKTCFSLKRHHGYSFDELDNLTPFERDVYVNMLHAALQEEEQKYKDAANK